MKRKKSFLEWIMTKKISGPSDIALKPWWVLVFYLFFSIVLVIFTSFGTLLFARKNNTETAVIFLFIGLPLALAFGIRIILSVRRRFYYDKSQRKKLKVKNKDATL